MHKKLLLALLITLAGCGNSSQTTISEAFHLWNENEFTISVPEGYERILPGQVDISLPQDFVAGYSEVRLDDNFATTVTVHREILQNNITTQTYALALRENVTNATDYKEISFTENNSRYTHVFEMAFGSTGTKAKVTQTAFVNNSKGWVVSCATVAENDPCTQILDSFLLK